jgi:hypothetical protein
VARQETEKTTKQERREKRRRAARHRAWARRRRRAGLAAAVLAVPALWAFDRSGPQELVDAEVTETRLWRHVPREGRSHPHTAATLMIEGLTEASVEKADNYERGQRVAVWIRRGRLTGRPYFLDVAKPGEIERQRRRLGATESP